MTQTPEHRRLVRIASGFNSKAKRYGVRGRVIAEQLGALPTSCWYCGVENAATFDHVNPLDRGGPNTIDNIVRCCTDDQRRKFTKNEREFAAHKALIVACVVCGKEYTPRWAEYTAGRARTCSLSCAGRKRWQ